MYLFFTENFILIFCLVYKGKLMRIDPDEKKIYLGTTRPDKHGRAVLVPCTKSR